MEEKVFTTNTPRPGDKPGSRDRSLPKKEQPIQVSITKTSEDTWNIIVQGETKIIESYGANRNSIWDQLIFEVTRLKPARES